MAKPGTLYVEFDALLDTRLGTLSLHYPEVFERCVKSDSYYLRDEDDFTQWGGPNREDFRALYDRRDMDVAQASILTAMPFVVKNLMGILERDFEETPYIKEVGMVINTYPYMFEEWEREELAKIMMIHGGLNVVPQVVRWPYSQLTPDVIAASYKGLIMYDFRYWLAEHQPLAPLKLHDISFIAPGLIHGKRPTAEDLREGGLKESCNPHVLTAHALREFLFLEPLPLVMFSSYRPDLVEQVMPKTQSEVPASDKDSPKTA